MSLTLKDIIEISIIALLAILSLIAIKEGSK